MVGFFQYSVLHGQNLSFFASDYCLTTFQTIILKTLHAVVSILLKLALLMGLMNFLEYYWLLLVAFMKTFCRIQPLTLLLMVKKKKRMKMLRFKKSNASPPTVMSQHHIIMVSPKKKMMKNTCMTVVLKYQGTTALQR